MRDTWTMEQLKSTDDIYFAIAVLNERANKLNPYAPLSKKISRATKTLEHIKTKLEKKCDMCGKMKIDVRYADLVNKMICSDCMGIEPLSNEVRKIEVD